MVRHTLANSMRTYLCGIEVERNLRQAAGCLLRVGIYLKERTCVTWFVPLAPAC